MSLFAVLGACRGKSPDPPAPVDTLAPPTMAPIGPAPAPAEPKKTAPPVVTPKTVDELAQRIVDALVAHDIARMKAYAPGLDFIDRHCPEQAPTMRTAYADKLEEAMNGAEQRSAECASLDWTGATLARATFKPSGGPPFYGCTPIKDGALDVVVAVGGEERTVPVPRIFVVGEAVYVGSMPRCQVKSPCGAIVKHLEEIVQASQEAPEAAPLSDEQRGAMVSFCDSFWSDPAQREVLACMRGAKNYGGIAACGQSLSTIFVSWPRK